MALDKFAEPCVTIVDPTLPTLFFFLLHA